MANKFSVFNSNILSWALKRAGMTVADLGFPTEKVEQWMNGQDYPTIKQTEKLAKKLDVPLPYFCLTRVPEEDGPLLPDFRTKGNHPVEKISIGLRKTIEHAIACQNFLRDYLKETEAHPFPYKERLNLDMTPETGAKIVLDILGERKTKGKPSELFLDIAKRIEQTGVLIQKNSTVLNSTKHKLETQEFRGFAIFDEYAPLIFINENDATRASLFTLIHEFCHILLSSSGISGLETNNRTEIFCDEVAVEYLVPKDVFLKFWKKYATKEPDQAISLLAKDFGTSEWLILRRARNLRCIPKDFYEKQLNLLLNYVPGNKPRKSGGPNYNVVQKSHFGERLIDAAVIAAYSGMISFTEAMGLTKLGLNGLEKKAKELRL